MVVIFPNPTSDIFHIKSSKNETSFDIEVYDSFGRFLLKSDQNQIDLTGFENGIYFVRTPGISDKTIKVIKQ
jgi:hypothetical protein